MTQHNSILYALKSCLLPGCEHLKVWLRAERVVDTAWHGGASGKQHNSNSNYWNAWEL